MPSSSLEVVHTARSPQPTFPTLKPDDHQPLMAFVRIKFRFRSSAPLQELLGIEIGIEN
jgi:hypothetical protein